MDRQGETTQWKPHDGLLEDNQKAPKSLSDNEEEDCGAMKSDKIWLESSGFTPAGNLVTRMAWTFKSLWDYTSQEKTVTHPAWEISRDSAERNRRWSPNLVVPNYHQTQEDWKLLFLPKDFNKIMWHRSVWILIFPKLCETLRDGKWWKCFLIFFFWLQYNKMRKE